MSRTTIRRPGRERAREDPVPGAGASNPTRAVPTGARYTGISGAGRGQQGSAVDRVNTSNGAIEVADARGDVAATTSNGDVDLTDVEGVVRGETSNGDVRIRNTPGVAGARTSNGTVDDEVLAMEADLTCSSSNGDVTVRAGPDVSAASRLSTNLGTVSVRDLPHTKTTERTGFVEGRIRDGTDPLLVLRTSNGDVTLRSA